MLVDEFVIPAPIEEVWSALTTVEGWRTWAIPLGREVPGSPCRFETGYETNAAPGAASTIEQKWIERVPPHSAAFHTARMPQGFPHADAYKRVISHFTLIAPGPSETRVHLESTGYPSRPADEALIAFI